MRTYNATRYHQTVFYENFSNLSSHQEYLRGYIDVYCLLHIMFQTFCQSSWCAVGYHDALIMDFSEYKLSWTFFFFHKLICHLRWISCENTANSFSHFYFYSFSLICRNLNILDYNSLSGLCFVSMPVCILFSVLVVNSAFHTLSYLLSKSSTFVQIQYV